MSELPVPEGEDSSEAYDRAHGTPTLADEQKLVNLGEGSNKPPPQAVPFKVSGGK